MIKESRLTDTFKWVLREMGQDRGHSSCKVDDPGLGELWTIFRSSLLPPSTLNPSDHCLSGAVEIYCRVSWSDLGSISRCRQTAWGALDSDLFLEFSQLVHGRGKPVDENT
jgi:hypothetical protein